MLFSQMAVLLEKERTAIRVSKISTNYSGDLAMEKRLLVDDAKIDGMILFKAISESRRSNRASSFNFTHDNGMKISNKTAAFGLFNHL
jgi:glutamate-5-semialdehyde dehydrogenase